MTETNKNSIPPSEYTEEYYKTSCLGYSEFFESKGKKLSRRFVRPLELADIREGMHVLDVGCGRGEVVINSVLLGAKVWGMDYSDSAVRITKDAVASLFGNESEKLGRICIHRANAQFLPFADESFHRVFMLDVVEHLNPSELNLALKEVHRILKPGGYLIVHTVPNLWYYDYGYPIFRLFQRLRGIDLPQNPRDRADFSHLHINEQTPSRLRRSLQAVNFRTRVWLESTVDYQYETNAIIRFFMKFLVQVYPFRWIFCNDIFAIAVKKNQERI